MSRSLNALTMNPPDGIASSRPSSSSRTSAIRTGVRDTPVVSTAPQFGNPLAGPQPAGQDEVAQRELGAHRLRYRAVGVAFAHLAHSAACSAEDGASRATMRSIMRRAHIAPASMLRL